MDTDADAWTRPGRGEPRGGRRPRRGRPGPPREQARAAERRRDPRGRAAAAGPPDRGARRDPVRRPVRGDGRRERIVYFSRVGDLAAYEELRSGFTAAVSHELRTPLARLLTLLETASFPARTFARSWSRRPGEVRQITELIDEVLFLSELESGARVVSLGPTPVRPGARGGARRARRAGGARGRRARARLRRTSRARDPPAHAAGGGAQPAENAIRYAGPGATFTLGVGPRGRRRRRSGEATTGSASTSPSSRASSSASTAPTRRGRRAAPGSVSRSSSTSSRRPAARSRRTGRAGGGLEIRCTVST